jgi:hypothetical protein
MMPRAIRFARLSYQIDTSSAGLSLARRKSVQLA